MKYSLRLTRKQTIRDSLIRRVKRVGDPDFWALRDASFTMVHGESLGVIGPNGAGKSTLLQVLAGILMPSEGVIEVDGHISSLLTLGVGFDEDLSGVDNIRLAGAFMGIDHRVIEDKLPAIIDYAEIGQFIDAPIKTYSAGMRARLGFAIATSVEPDILLLDEVLATGDAAFREKSKARVLELVREAKAIVLVTHDMQWVDRVLQPGDPHRAGPDRAPGPARRGRGAPQGAHGAAPCRGEGGRACCASGRPSAASRAGADPSPSALPAWPSRAPRPPKQRRDQREGGADRERPAPVQQRADVTGHLLRDHHEDPGRPVDRDLLGDQRADEPLLDRGLAGGDHARIALRQAHLARERCPDAPELDAEPFRPGGADAAPLDEHLLGIERPDAADVDLDAARRRLADAAAFDPQDAVRRPGGRRVGLGLPAPARGGGGRGRPRRGRRRWRRRRP